MKLFRLDEKTKRLILTAFCGIGLAATGFLAGAALSGGEAPNGQTPARENERLSVEAPAELPPEAAPPPTKTDAAPIEEPEDAGEEVYASNKITYVLILENEGMLVIMERSAAPAADRRLMELPFEAAELDDAEREELSGGMEFETLSEIDEYLESAES